MTAKSMDARIGGMVVGRILISEYVLEIDAKIYAYLLCYIMASIGVLLARSVFTANLRRGSVLKGR